MANAGSDHGVRVGFIAINENGLVGRVVSVGRRSSRVLMLDDYNSRIPVMGEASRVRAVLAGQATQPPELYTRPFEVESPRLDFIVGAQSLREGERMVTSGDGGLYPRGVAVGLARHGSDGVWRVTLATTRQPIDFVRLVPFVGAPRPEDAPVDDAGPPPDARSAVASVGREVMPPPPIASQRPGAVIPRTASAARRASPASRRAAACRARANAGAACRRARRRRTPRHRSRRNERARLQRAEPWSIARVGLCLGDRKRDLAGSAAWAVLSTTADAARRVVGCLWLGGGR
ncbi:MAG: rod shape-determining protein MreC [Terricaulis sp.]